VIPRSVGEPKDPEWVSWKKRAAAGREALIEAVEAGGDPEIDEDLYKAQKRLIWELFYGKCAYCEVLLTGNQPGDIEHYRPKKGLVDDEFKPVVDAATGKQHRGYYWLAYEWMNLLPSCANCNRPTTRGGHRSGKGNRFPVRGARAFKPGDEANEEPLLLHPYLSDPDKHLKFDESTGVVAPLTEEGGKTIEVLDLNRDGLLEERARACLTVRGLLSEFGSAINRSDVTVQKKLGVTIKEYLERRVPYSAITRPLILRWREAVLSVFGF
jgi:uncharacterized protein (TIGR02646 family)